MEELRPPPTAPRWKQAAYEVIFESDTPAGKAFDVILLATITISVVVVLLESVPRYAAEYGEAFFTLEWIFTIVFTIEYAARSLTISRPRRYIFSFYGVVDLLAVLPTYLSLIAPGAQYFLLVRVLRMLRIFRILKLTSYTDEAEMLGRAMYASRRKITIFLLTVVSLIILVGAIIYVIEGPENGFTSIPISIYWAVVTLTTVGFGDIVPQTSLGKALAMLVMLIGYSIIAVPTGIVTVELSRAPRGPKTPPCPGCGRAGHDQDAVYCKYCGGALEEE